MSNQSSIEALREKLPVVKSILNSYDIPENCYTFTAFKSNLEGEYKFLVMSKMDNYFTGSILEDLFQENINVKII